MAFCAKCGAQVNGRFCGTCGADVEAAGGGGFQSTPPNPSASAGAGGLTDNMAGALCYALGVLTGIIFLALEPYNRNREIRFHAWQSIFLFGGLFILYVGLTIFSYVIPGLLVILMGSLMLIVNLGVFVLWLFLMFRTYNNQKTVLPVIGPLAEQKA